MNIQVKAKKVTRTEYLHRAENGVATLFNWLGYRFLEGDNYESNPVISYFIFVPAIPDEEEEEYYLITEHDMFDLVKMNYVYNPDSKNELLEQKLIDLGIITYE